MEKILKLNINQVLNGLGRFGGRNAVFCIFFENDFISKLENSRQVGISCLPEFLSLMFCYFWKRKY